MEKSERHVWLSETSNEWVSPLDDADMTVAMLREIPYANANTGTLGDGGRVVAG
jgi:hypothetical protein